MNIQTKPTRDPAAQLTLMQKIQKRAWDSPGKTAFVVFSDLSQEGTKITYGELDRKAKEIAATLQSFTLPQEKALLIFSPGLDFITALFGCLYAGVIAVPVCPPDFKHLDRDLPFLKDIITKTQANVVLTDDTFFSLSGYFFLLAPDHSSILWFAIDRIGMASEYDFRPIPIMEQFIAILDYQPGSATFPDGVNLTYANLLSSLKTNESLLNFTEGAVNLSWLPPFHENGLVEGILQGVFSGCENLLVPTHFVLEDPLVWLKLISRYKVTISGGPDDIYDRCSTLISKFQIGNLQLGQWATAYTSSNKLTKASIDNFYNSFKYYGFKRESFVPYYGLIGASLIVSGISEAGWLLVTCSPNTFFTKNRRKKVIIPEITGVAIQPRPMPNRVFNFISLAPFIIPIPSTEPMITCVLETGTSGMGGSPMDCNALENEMDENKNNTRPCARTTTIEASGESDKSPLPTVFITFSL